MQFLDYVLILPAAGYAFAFFLVTQATGDANKGYQLFGSKRAGDALFMVMVSGMVLGPIALFAFLAGVIRIAIRVF